MENKENLKSYPVITKDNTAKTIYEVFSKLVSRPSIITFGGKPYSDSIAEQKFDNFNLERGSGRGTIIELYIYNDTDLGLPNCWGLSALGESPVYNDQIAAAVYVQF